MSQEGESRWSELLRGAQAGQTLAREELCRELTVRLRQVVKHRVWDWPRQDQEDLVQDCLVTFLQKLDQVNSSPQGYACEILRYKIGNALQRKSAYVHIQTDKQNDSNALNAAPALTQRPEDTDGFVTEIERRDSTKRIADAIERLPDFCRNLFLGLLQEKSVLELWTFFRSREPELQRSAFDKRIFDCRRRLRLLIGDSI